jgi:hypothetical protein
MRYEYLKIYMKSEIQNRNYSNPNEIARRTRTCTPSLPFIKLTRRTRWTTGPTCHPHQETEKRYQLPLPSVKAEKEGGDRRSYRSAQPSRSSPAFRAGPLGRERPMMTAHLSSSTPCPEMTCWPSPSPSCGTAADGACGTSDGEAPAARKNEHPVEEREASLAGL